jgi:NodT family efflux transporter outer membrane factor (OMF) lipoprotein
MRASKRRLLLLGCASALGACAVQPPAPPLQDPLPARLTESELPGFDAAAAPPARWWARFGSAPLDALVDEALRTSPTVAAASARLQAAGRLADAERHDARWPRAGLAVSAARQRVDPAAMGIRGAPGSMFSLYGVGVDVRYDLDVAGGRAAGAEAAAARAAAARAQVEAARAMLAGNVVAAALHAAAFEAQLRLRAEALAWQRERLAIATRETAIGARSQAALLAEQGALDSAEAALAPLRQALATERVRLATLLGRAPAAGLPPLPRWAALSASDDPIAVGLPADVVARRPDVRLSESRVREAAAQAGMAAAALYPQLTLGGSASSQRQRLADLADGLNVWHLALSLAQPLLDAPALRARRDAAQAAHAAALADHRDTVARALGEVAAAMHAVHEGAARAQALRAAAARAGEQAAIAAERARLGGASRLERVEAARRAAEAQGSAVDAEAAHRLALAALLQAVGGAWP